MFSKVESNEQRSEWFMDKVKSLYKIFEKIKLFGVMVSGLSAIVMMAFIAVNVISRYFLAGSITGSFEFVTYYFLPLSVFPALGYVYSSGVLPKMDLLIQKAHKKIRDILIVLLLLLELFLFSLIIYYSFHYSMTGMAEGHSFTAGVDLYPLYPVYFLVPLGFTLMTIEILFIMTKNVIEKRVSMTMDHVQ